LNDERARRVGLNEALFREVNEQIRGLAAEFSVAEGAITVICECGNGDCTERLEVPIADYERVRGESTLCLVAKGHVFPDLEQVEEETAEYDVVRKREGTPADVARETNPRL
jgi:hypothetical protein